VRLTREIEVQGTRYLVDGETGQILNQLNCSCGTHSRFTVFQDPVSHRILLHCDRCGEDYPLELVKERRFGNRELTEWMNPAP